MSNCILIDDRGRKWPDSSWELARRIGYRDPTLNLPSFAVRERGFIHIRPQEGGIRVALCAGAFKLAALATALYTLKDEGPRRIVLAIFSEGEWFYEILTTVWELAERAELLAAGAPLKIGHPYLPMERNLGALSLPIFARLRPIMKLWHASRGRLPDDFERSIDKFGLLHRMIFARQRHSRLVYAHFGSGIEFVRPCESFLMIDRNVGDGPDQAYGARTSQAYAEALTGHRPRLESIHATIRMSETTAIQGHYDRLLLPWHGDGSERFVMGISLTRAANHRLINDVRQVG